MVKVEADFLSLDSTVQVVEDQGLSLDVIFKINAFLADEEDENGKELENPDAEIVDDSAVVGEVDVKVYDEKWVDYWYAADADGAHMHIFVEAVCSVVKENVSPKVFHKNDGEIDGKHMVWGRVAVLDNNFHSLNLDKACWDKENATNLFLGIEDFLVDMMNVDFIVLDLFHYSYESAINNPGFLLLTDSDSLKSMEEEDQFLQLKNELEKELLSQGFIYSGDKKEKRYMIKKYDHSYTYKTKSKNNNRTTKEVLKSF